MTRKSRTVLLAIIALLSCLAIMTIVASTAYSSNTALAKITAKTDSGELIGLYSDSICTIPLTSFNWGAIPQGGSTNQTIYLKNLSTTKLTLTMSATNWSPTAANGPISLTWNCGGTTLKPNQIIPATITIAVASNATDITNFTMDITITGASIR